MINFTNTYSKLPSSFFEEVMPEKVSSPKLLCFNEKLADTLGINYQNSSVDDLAQIFSGSKLLPGSNPIAMAYAGYQFGHPVFQLGDGRAHLLGEVKGFDIQLKGSGKTKFSRNGDGKSALGPVIREYLVSEAMHALGVPTSRSLCAVATGDEVLRQDGFEPGGIFTRVADSHIRVGTFQYFSFRKDINSIKTLLNYAIKRHYPDLKKYSNEKDKAIEFLKKIIENQSDLIAKWSSLGFIHGVMNTDNFSIAGITIDYGPCAFLDEFKYDKVFSSIDRNGRYSFFNQVPIAKWNILRLAECFLPLISDNQKEALQIIESEVVALLDIFDKKRMTLLGEKIGIKNLKASDETLVHQFLAYLEKESLDFTLAFREITNLYNATSTFFPKTKDLASFIESWRDRVSLVPQLNEINPIYIPRNHLVQKAIDEAYEGNYDFFNQLLKVISDPYREKNGLEKFAHAPEPHERVYQTFCGT